MAITLGSPISADLLYQFYDNKAITPQIRAALQKREDAETAGEDYVSSSKYGPATKVSITDQLIRMNISNNSTGIEKEEGEESTSSRRYDALTEIKKRLAEQETADKAAKEEKLNEIKEKIAEAEAARDAENAEGTEGAGEAEGIGDIEA